MSPSQGRRPTPGRGEGAAGRRGGAVEARRLGLLAFGAAFLVLFVVVAVAEGVGDPGVPDDAVAVVEDVPGDGGEITRAEFRRAMVQAAAQAGQGGVPKPGDDQYEELRDTALGGLLDIAWLRGQAEEMGISVGEKELAEELKTLKEESFENEAEYKEFLKEAKFTQEDVDERVELQVLSNEIQERITEEAQAPGQGEIEGYYEAAKATQFTRQASRDIRVVVNEDRKKAARAKAQLEEDDSAKGWRRVARRFSEDEATKDSGGLQQGAVEGALEEPLNEAVFETPENQLEGPLKTPRGFYVFEVVDTTPEEVQPLSDVEAQIESQLEQQAQQEVFAAFIEDFGSKWVARTFCAEGFTTERCANFKGDGHPATAPPGCYEANPEGGRPEACPAPVFQLVPALPGSVTPLEPRGTPLAQRPRPAGGEEAEAPAGLPGGVPPVAP